MAIDSSNRHLTEVHYTLSERIDQHPTRMLHSQRSDPHRSNLPSRLISSNLGEQVTDALLGTIAMILGERGGKKVHAENASSATVNRAFDFVAQHDMAVHDEI